MNKLSGYQNCLDSQLWQACAGTMVKIPAVNSIVLYFPQGHAEHAGVNVEFRSDIRIPSYIPCRVSAIKYMAEHETDEVFAKIRLTPISPNEFFEIAEEGMLKIGSDNPVKPLSFAKILTQSDANNGGGFSVPKFCADTVFPPLNFNVNRPSQTLLARDIHGKVWQFKHVFRGTPERHLLITGWSTFVNEKKLVAGDSVVFLRDENDDVSVGIRRIKKKSVPMELETEISPWWFPSVGNLTIPRGGFSAFLKEDQNWNLMNRGKVKAESVIEATNLATNGRPFEVTFYPHSDTPEFFVKASRVKAALQIHWCSGMRFKMPFETEDSVISWFMGTISSIQVVDPSRWPDSPWRILQVTWDEPNLIHNVNCVNPWQVELVSNMPNINFTPYTPPLKKIRLSHHSDFALDAHLPMNGFLGNHLRDAHLPMSGFSDNHLLMPNVPFSYLLNDTPIGMQSPFGYLPNNTPVGMQGASHAPYGLSLPVVFPSLHHVIANRSASNNTTISKPSNNDDISCLLTLESSTQTGKKNDCKKTPQFILFGQPIFIEQQISLSNSNSPVRIKNPVRITNSFFDGNEGTKENISDSSDTTFDHNSDLPCESFQSEQNVEVFIESEDVERTLNLSLLGSYEKLSRELSNMSGIEISKMFNHVIYRDIIGAVKQLGDEPFRHFMKTARRLIILMEANNDNIRVRE